MFSFTKKKSHRRSLTTIALAVVASSSLLLAGCATSGAPEADKTASGTIKVGVLASTTGALATYGIAERQGIEIAIANANADGGINGQKIEAVWYDPAGDTAKAIEQVNRMVQQDDVKVILDASASSGVALAIKPIVQAANVVMVSAGAAAAITDPASLSPLTFGTTLSTDFVAAKMVEYLSGKGVKNVGILSSSDGYGKAGAQSLDTALAAAGIAHVTVEYDPAATDLTSQLRAMQEKKYGAIINWTSGSTGVVFFKNAQQLKIADDTLVMASFTFSNPALMEQAGDASKGIIVGGIKATLLAVLPDSDPQKKVIADFDASLQKAYKVPVTIYAAQAHDMAIATFAGIEAAGTTNATKLAAALQKLTMSGVQGTYKFTPEDHRGLGTRNVEMMQWDGKQFVQLAGK